MKKETLFDPMTIMVIFIVVKAEERLVLANQVGKRIYQGHFLMEL